MPCRADIVALTASTAVYLAATVLGAVIGSRECRFAAADACIGLGAAGGVVTLLGVFTSVGLSVWAALLGLCAVAAAGWLAWTHRRCGGRGQWLALVVMLPLLISVAQQEPTHWDEFAQWLPNAAYLYRHDSFPRAGLPLSTSYLPGYPYASPLFIDFASLLAGQFTPSAGGLLNLLLLSSCVTALICIINETNRMKGRWLNSKLSCGDVIAIVSVGGIVLTLLSPSFDREFTFTALPDCATGVAVAMCTMLCWLTLERLGGEQWIEARGLALQLGFTGAFLINLKQSNVALLVLLSCAFLLVVLRDARIATGKAIRLLPAIVGPGLIVWGAWHFHIMTNLADSEKTILPMAEWHIDILPEILAATGQQILDHSIFFTLMFGLSMFGVGSFLRNSVNIDRLLAIVAVTWLGYTCFLIFVNIAVFCVDEAAAAAQYWRYASHFGVVSIFTVVALLAWFWPGHQLMQVLRAMSMSTLLILPAVIVYSGKRLAMPDDDDELLLCRKIGRDLADALPNGARLAILDPNGTGFCSFVIRYEILRPGQDDRNLRVVWQSDLWFTDPPDGFSRVAPSFSDPSISHLIIVNPSVEYAEALNVIFENNGTFLLGRAEGKWHVLRSWVVSIPSS